VLGADGVTYTLAGSFTYGSGTFPSSGTITQFTADDGSGDVITYSGLNLSVGDFNHFVGTENGQGLLNEIAAGNDTFDLTGAGTSNVFGGAGDDTFLMGGTLSAGDVINGGGGANTVILDGTTTAVLNDNTLGGIENLNLSGDFAYDITTADGNIADHHLLTVNAKAIGGTGSLIFDGSAETNGHFDFFLGGNAGTDVKGGAGNDIFNGAGSGATLRGEGGNDTFIFGGNFNGTDDINGGAGVNIVTLHGDYSGGLIFGADSLVNIDKVILNTGGSYDLTLAAANSVKGDAITFNGSGLQSGETLTLDAGAATGKVVMDGGAGNDTLIGGSSANTFDGGLGADTMTAGTSLDRFIYTAVDESTGTTHDTINGFDGARDLFILNSAVNAIDAAVTAGSLSAASFNADLATDVGASQLHSGDAVLFTASSGDMAGDTFLIVDQNGTAGYQANADLVIELTGAHHLTDLSTANFTVA
jgi:hypothetical protein